MSTVTVAPTVEPSTGRTDPPRVRLDVTDTGVDPITAVTVTRLDPDGRTVPVRTFDGNPLALTPSGGERTGLLYDYEAPLGAEVRYSTVEDPGTVSAPVTVDEPAVWLIHPGVPALSRPVRVLGISARERAVARGVHHPMGRRAPVVQTDGQRKAPAYTLTFRTDNLDERDGVDDLLDDGGTLLLNVPAGKGWGVGAEYVSPGDISEANEAGWGAWPRRVWTLPCLVVDRPAGGSQAERTLLDLLDYPTLDSLAVAYDSLNDLLAGP